MPTERKTVRAREHVPEGGTAPQTNRNGSLQRMGSRLVQRVINAARRSAREIEKTHRGECSCIPDENSLVAAVRALDKHENKSATDPKLSDCGGWRAGCMAGGKAAVEAASVTAGAVRCSAWLGAVGFIVASWLPK